MLAHDNLDGYFHLEKISHRKPPFGEKTKFKLLVKMPSIMTHFEEYKVMFIHLITNNKSSEKLRRMYICSSFVIKCFHKNMNILPCFQEHKVQQQALALHLGSTGVTSPYIIFITNSSSPTTNLNLLIWGPPLTNLFILFISF